MNDFRVNVGAVLKLDEGLKKLSRSAYPIAVRGTLNDAAFDVKRNTLQKSATNNFIRRSPTFFRAFSGVNKAGGFNVSGMRADVGMTDMGNVNAQTAVHNLEYQERGGVISDGADYLKASRVGGNLKRKVRKADYFDKTRILNGKFKRNGTSKSNYVAAAYAGLKQNKLISINTQKGRFLMQVTSINKSKKGVIKIRSKLLIKDRGGKPANIRATHFSREAAYETLKHVQEFYNAQAKRQYERALKIN